MSEWTTADQRAEYIRHHDLRERLRTFLEDLVAEPDNAELSNWTALDRLLKLGDLRDLYKVFELRLLNDEEKIEHGLHLVREELRRA